MSGIKRDAADSWFSKAVRARDEWCLSCGKEDNLQCAHIYGRRKKITRWDMDNAVTLCAGCHRHYTEHPLSFHDWLEKTLGEGHMAILREKSNGIMKTNAALRKEIAKHYREQVTAFEQDDQHEWINFN